MNNTLEKSYFSILRNTPNTESNDYLFLNDGFNIKNKNIYYDIDTKEKVDKLKENYKNIMYRIRYNNYARFFTELDLENDNINIFSSYLKETHTEEKKVYLTYPVNLYFKTNDDQKILLNGKKLCLYYQNVVNNENNLPKDPSVELANNGKIVNIIRSSNRVLINKNDSYKDPIELIINEDIVLHKTYQVGLNTLSNVLIYNNKIIGKMEDNESPLYENESLKPCISYNGFEFDISYGISSIVKETEEFIYYPTIEKMIGSTSFNEYDTGDVLYVKETNSLYLVYKDKVISIDFQNVVTAYHNPKASIDNIGTLWIDLSYGMINIYNGYMWVPLSRPSLEIISNQIVSNRNFGKETDNIGTLELYGYNDAKEFFIFEKVVAKDMVMDVEFPIEDNVIQSAFVNGEEIYAWTDAAYGIHLNSPLYRGAFNCY